MIQINLLTGRLLSGGRRIPLTQGQSTVVDDEDYDRLNQYKWYARWNPLTKSFYAQREIRLPNRKRATQYLHREIIGLQPGDPRHCHHDNRNTLDNRRENLEIVTLPRNTDPASRREENASEPKQRSGGRRYHVGMFDTPEEAQKARRLYVGTGG